MYKISITRSANKELYALPNQSIIRIVDEIDALSHNPRPESSKKLKGTKANLWRIRIGSYRIIYEIDDEIKIIDIMKIGHRKDIYK